MNGLIALPIILVIAGLLILWFEVWMFLDLLSNKNISSNDKILWALGMLLLHPFVALFYYFKIYKHT